MPVPRQFFPGIHALRAIAATMVVVEHAGFVAKDYSTLKAITIIPHFYWGRIGVIVFFAISGFVIALQRTKPVGTFIQHRLLRIYPSYWLALLISAIAFALVGLPVNAGPASILLYPGTASKGAMWIPYWSLAFEMVFYALAVIAFGLRLSDRSLLIIALLWIAAVNLFAWAPRDSNEYEFPGAWILLAPAVQIFPMGLICGVYYEGLRQIGRWPYVAAVPLLFVASFPFEEFSAGKLLLLGLSASCLVVAVADLGKSRVIEWLGDASYGIYLMHFPAMIFAAAIAPLGFAWCSIVGMASGTAFGLFDHRLYGWLLGKVIPMEPHRSR